ncbi:MAG: CAP domain-containing protein [Actinomycetaceae bacterium]|nr:CAP domain-containing protein [Actinomycetaceae bacterium]
MELTSAEGNIKAETLAEITRIRKDALDQGVPWPEKGKPKTMRQYLEEKGIAEADYLAPVWSAEAERLAIIRAAETHLTNIIGHLRPNEEKLGSLLLKLGAFREGIAWAKTSAAESIGQFEREKPDWVNNTKDKVTGHYEQLIDPELSSFGMAGFVGPEQAEYQSTWTLVSHSTKDGQDQSASGISGKHTFKVMLHPEWSKVNTSQIWV